MEPTDSRYNNFTRYTGLRPHDFAPTPDRRLLRKW